MARHGRSFPSLVFVDRPIGAMIPSPGSALPTTNLTFHCNASVNTKVFNTGSTSATDGQAIEQWADAEGKDLSFWYLIDATHQPAYRDTTPLMLENCVDFDGSTDTMGLFNNAGAVAKTLADVMGASAKTILISFYATTISPNAANAYDNDPLIGDLSQYFGLFLKNVSGTYKLQAYNFDGTADVVEATVSLTTSYVAMVRHNGTNLYLSINGGSESSVASGATQVTTGAMRLAYVAGSGAPIANVRIGEIAIYNADLSTQGTDLASAISYFTAKWITGGSPDVTVALSGAAVNCAAGTAAVDRSTACAGAAVNCAAGTPGVDRAPAFAGVAVNASAGTPGVSSSLAVLTGATANAAAGTASASIPGGATLSGAATNVNAGTPVVSSDLVALPGATANTAAGTITVASTAVTAALSGATANVRAGTASVTDVQLPAIFYDTTYVAPTGFTLSADTAGLQAAIDAANLGDTILLTPGSFYVGKFVLKSGKSGTGYIHIRSSAALTPEGIRITTAQAASFPKIVGVNGDPASPLTAEPGSSYYRIINCEITSGNTPVNGAVVALGAGDENSYALFPNHMIVDRCYVHGSATLGGRRGVMFTGSYMAVIDSYISDIKEVGADTQAIGGWTGQGVWKVVNNYLEAAGENLLIGGVDVAGVLTGLTPSDIEIRNNYLFKPLTWKIGHPSYLGVAWTVKNTLEIKHAKRVLIDGNLIENCWAHAQTGQCVLFTVRNQSGSNPWATVEDVTFRYNTITNSDNGFNLLGHDTEASQPSDYARRCYIHHNLMTKIGGVFTGDGILIQIGVGYQDVTFDHNTLLHDPAAPVSGSTISVYSEPCPRFKFTNNIVQHNVYGIKGDATNSGTPTIDTFFPGATVTKNAFPHPTDTSGNNVPGWGPPTAADGAWYPLGNTFPVAVSDIGFINYPTDLRLSASSLYQDTGTDGLDIGYAETAAGVVITQPYTLISHTAAASTDDVSVTTPGIDTTGANLIVLATGEDDSSIPVASDSKANIWTKLTTYGGGTGFVPRVTLWYCFNPNVGPGHTFSNNAGPASYPAISVAAFSGAGTAPFDLQNGFTSSNTGVNTIQPGSITPASAGELVMTGFSFGTTPSGTTPLIDGGFAVTDWADDSAHSYGVALAYLIQSTPVAANPTWTHGSVTPVVASASIAAFKGVPLAVFKAYWAYSCNELVGV